MTTRTVPATLYSQLKSKIEAREARVAVIGLGYVGLPLTLLYTEQKFPVTGFDIDQRKVTALNKGESYIYRIPAPEIQQAREPGLHRDVRLRAHHRDGRHHHLRPYAAERVSRA